MIEYPFGGITYTYMGGPRDGQSVNLKTHISELLIPDASGGTHWYEGKTYAKAVSNEAYLYTYTLSYLGKSYTNDRPEQT